MFGFGMAPTENAKTNSSYGVTGETGLVGACPPFVGSLGVAANGTTTNLG
jgi:hypothetical protein